MVIKDNIMNILIGHPKLLSAGIGLAVTFSIGILFGMLDHQQITFATTNAGKGRDI